MPPNTTDGHPMARRWLEKRLADNPAGEIHCPDCERVTALADGFCQCGWIPEEEECKEMLASEISIADRRNTRGLDDVIGNPAAVSQIRVTLGAHRARLAKVEERAKAGGPALPKPVFPHLLLCGTGSSDEKTMVTEIVARELKRPIHLQAGQSLNSPARVGDALLSLNNGDVLFIDEIQNVDPIYQQTLFEAMRYGVLQTVAKAGTADQEVKRTKLPPFILIGSATHEGELPSLLRKQFEYCIRLGRMTVPELAEAIAERAALRGLKLDATTAAMIAEQANFSPQVTRRLLDACMDAALAHGGDIVDAANVRLTCEILDIGPQGHDTKSASGHVYVLLNSTMPGLVKIGKTEREPEERAKELSCGTGIPTPFVVAYAESFNDCSAAEDYVHSLMEEKGFRVSQNREFFCAPVKAAIQAIMKAKEREDRSDGSEAETCPQKI